jgi:predicted unusual protein kinase regulating ubiquinone biosynthesis (AarF/ABC1/UbiB family)
MTTSLQTRSLEVRRERGRVNRTTLASLAGLAAAAAGATAAAAKTKQLAAASPLTNKLARSTKIWKLSARNSARFAVSRVRGFGSPADRRAELDTQFAIRTAEDVAKELGEMKGVLMKAGQLVSFIFETLPEEAQAALATLQSDASPMAPSLAASVVESELGLAPERAFLDWGDAPVAAASIGQVHFAVTHEGRDVAVKVQYPGVQDAIESDLDAAEVMYGMFSALMLKGLDAKGLVDELRARMREELDYRLEARNVDEFTNVFAGHPWVRIPRLVPELSTGKLLTTEWVDGLSFDEFRTTASRDTKQRAAEVIWRFSQHSVNRNGAFNGDPHPGNYKFHHDGSVTFLDFGLVKRWSPGEWDLLRPTLEAVIVHRDPELLVQAMESSGFLRTGHALDPEHLFDYVSSPYQPYLTDEFTFSRQWMIDTLGKIFDVQGPHADVIESLNMPPSFVILDRVVWGINAILGKLDAEGPFRAMLLEYVDGGEPATDLGAAEAAWRAGLKS